MKRALAIILAALMVLVLCACGSDASKAVPDSVIGMFMEEYGSEWTAEHSLDKAAHLDTVSVTLKDTYKHTTETYLFTLIYEQPLSAALFFRCGQRNDNRMIGYGMEETAAEMADLFLKSLYGYMEFKQ